MGNQFTNTELIIIVAMIINFIAILCGVFTIIKYIKTYREKKVRYLLDRLKKLEDEKPSDSEDNQKLFNKYKQLTEENKELQNVINKFAEVINKTN